MVIGNREVAQPTANGALGEAALAMKEGILTRTQRPRRTATKGEGSSRRGAETALASKKRVPTRVVFCTVFC